MSMRVDEIEDLREEVAHLRAALAVKDEAIVARDEALATMAKELRLTKEEVEYLKRRFFVPPSRGYLSGGAMVPGFHSPLGTHDVRRSGTRSCEAGGEIGHGPKVSRIMMTGCGRRRYASNRDRAESPKLARMNRPDSELSNMQVPQSGSSVTIFLVSSTGGICNYTGTYTQLGHLGAITGTSSCSNGAKGSLVAFELDVNISRITGRFVAQNQFCPTIQGRWGGLRCTPY